MQLVHNLHLSIPLILKTLHVLTINQSLLYTTIMLNPNDLTQSILQQLSPYPLTDRRTILRVLRQSIQVTTPREPAERRLPRKERQQYIRARLKVGSVSAASRKLLDARSSDEYFEALTALMNEENT